MMSPSERQAMRAALATALRTGDIPDATVEHPGPFVDTSPPIGPDLIERFTSELQALGGTVHHLVTDYAVAALIADLARREGVPRVLAWDETWLPVKGLASSLTALGIEVVEQRAGEAQDPQARELWASAGVGVTGAEACLAETGSLALVSGPGRGRLASLLPPVHVALVVRSSLRPSFPMLLSARPELATAGSNLVCITGPSRTADIEHTLSRGVHGPRDIHVVFVD